MVLLEVPFEKVDTLLQFIGDSRQQVWMGRREMFFKGGWWSVRSPGEAFAKTQRSTTVASRHEHQTINAN